MRLLPTVCALLIACGGGIAEAQKAAPPTHRYFRVICLVHLTGSGKKGDPIVPEYVVEGTATAQAVAGQTTTGQTTAAPGNSGNAAHSQAQAAQTAAPEAPMSSRPGILAWSMQKSDDGKMAILHLVAADHHAFDSILADKRPEIRAFEIGKDSPDAIQKEMKKYRKDFDLESFQVVVQ